MRYAPERKEAVLKKMMPPHNRSISQLAGEEGICEATLYNWRNEARKKLKNYQDRVSCILIQEKVKTDLDEIEAVVDQLLTVCSRFDLAARFA